MIETMHEYHGVGLAAPQVHESLRLFVGAARRRPGRRTTSRWSSSIRRSCRRRPAGGGLGGLSQHPRHPRPGAAVHRHLVKALDRDGRPIELRLKDFPARVAQHETDHLDGVLFFDRMTSMQTLTYMDEYSPSTGRRTRIDADLARHRRRPRHRPRDCPGARRPRHLRRRHRPHRATCCESSAIDLESLGGRALAVDDGRDQ